MDTYQFLSTVEPFRQLIPEQLLAVSQSFAYQRFSPGDFLGRQGEPIEHVAIIRSGLAKVSIQDHRGDELLAEYLRPNDFFMDIATLSGIRATASVISLKPTVCAMQTHHAFIDMLDEHPRLKRYFYHHAAQGIRLNPKWGQCCNTQKLKDEACKKSLPEPIRKALTFIDGHYHQPITLDMVASEVAMSRFRLSHMFNKHMGQSIKRYVNRKRIMAAKDLLSGSGYNVTEAGYAVGFNDAAYFTRVFIDLEGSSPKHFLAK